MRCPSLLGRTWSPTRGRLEHLANIMCRFVVAFINGVCVYLNHDDKYGGYNRIKQLLGRGVEERQERRRLPKARQELNVEN